MAAAMNNTNPIFVTCGDRRTDISPFGYAALLRDVVYTVTSDAGRFAAVAAHNEASAVVAVVATQRPAYLPIFRRWDDSSSSTVNVRNLRQYIDLNTNERRRT